MRPPDEHIDLIVAAMLAANNFQLLRSQAIVPSLRQAQLLDPEVVCKTELGPLTVKLASAGYDRGMLTSMFAGRLQSVMKAVRDGVLDSVPQAVAAGNEAACTATLMQVDGIGPSVARTAWSLLVAVHRHRKPQDHTKVE